MGQPAGHPQGGPEEMVQDESHIKEAPAECHGAHLKKGGDDTAVPGPQPYMPGHQMGVGVQVIPLHHGAVPVPLNLRVGDSGLFNPLSDIGVAGTVQDIMGHEACQPGKGCPPPRLPVKYGKGVFKKNPHGFVMYPDTVLINPVLAK